MSGADEYKMVSQHTEVSDEKLTSGSNGQTDEKADVPSDGRPPTDTNRPCNPNK